MKNLGSTDKILRYVVGIALAIVAYVYMDTLGVWLWVAIAAAVIMIGTATINFCPLYRIFGINTCKIK